MKMVLFIFLKISIIIIASLVISMADANTSESPSNNVPEPCKKVMKQTRKVHRNITIFGKDRRLEVQWGSGETNIANAALLFVTLKYVHGYKDTALVEGNKTLCELASNLPDYDEDSAYDKLVIHVGATPPENNLDCPALYTCEDPRDICAMAGPRLDIMGLAMAPIDPQLNVLNEPRQETLGAACTKLTCNSSLTNFKNCSFLFLQDLYEYNKENNTIISKYPNRNCVNEYNEVIADCTPVLLNLDLNDEYYKVSIKRLAKTMEHSNYRCQLIFLKTKNEITLTKLSYTYFSLHPPHHSKPAYRVAPGKLLQQFAPRILSVVRRFAPAPEDIKGILKISNIEVEKAACQYFSQYSHKFKDWASAHDPVPAVHVLLCKDDTDNELYKLISGKVAFTLNEFNVYFSYINCNNENDFNQMMYKRAWDMRWMRVIGLIGRGAGAPLAVQAASTTETQLVLYDVPSDTTILCNSTRTATGRVKPLALALNEFLVQNGWRRIAIISDRTHLAEDFSKTLCANRTISHRERFIDGADLKMSAEETLQIFSGESVPGRIFFVNTNATAAGILLCAAISFGMTDRQGYAWIVREWGSPPPPCNLTGIRPFTVTYWWRGGNESHLKEIKKERPPEFPTILYLRKEINNIYSVWPPFMAPLVDAILLLYYEYKAALDSYPGLRYNLHRANNSKLFASTFTDKTEVQGIVQTLKQKDYSQENPLVFIYAWRESNIFDLLAVWQVEKETINVISIVNETYPDRLAPLDGSRNCITVSSGDPYDPTCHDKEIFSSVALFAIILLLVYLGHRYWVKTLKKREHMMQMRMLARSQRTAETLGPYLVSRSSLETREELGTGNFGRVHFGLLKTPKWKIPVAVKSLREDASLAEESMFLHEACMLSRLSHVNIVRLVGVCAADGPPLVMMEHAFFCDLCCYLRARRHYAEIEDCEMGEQGVKEALSISAKELTRLAREAASALDYLCFKKIVHRDVRAANCLIDGSRTLKLADFGMAREMTSSKTLETLDQVNSSVRSNGITGEFHGRPIITASMDYSYFCKRRRDKFPLSWMAPESISIGEFSSASDVWSLGVTIFEIVMLGQHPFASWSLQRIYDHMINGGIPELPLEISYESREVIEMCWWEEPRKRATAAAIRTHLAANPTALRHALGRKRRYSAAANA